MDFVASWTGVVLKPSSAFEDLKKEASLSGSLPHYIISFIPNVLGMFIALMFGASFGVNSLLGLFYAIISLIVFIAVSYFIAKALGGTGSMEEHVYCQGVGSAAYAFVITFAMLIIVGLALALLGSMAGPLAAAFTSHSALSTFISQNIGELIGKAIILGVIALILLLVFGILSIRTYYYFLKTVHGFGVGKFILFLVCLLVAQIIIGFIAVMLSKAVGLS